MDFYRKHYKLTSLILLSVTLACLGYVQEKIFEELEQHLTDTKFFEKNVNGSNNTQVKTIPNLKCYYLIAKKTLIEY